MPEAYQDPRPSISVRRRLVLGASALLTLSVYLASGGTPARGQSRPSAAMAPSRWFAQYDGPGNSYDSAAAVVVSPDGGTVFVTGGSADITSDDYATVAYRAGTGSQRWVARYNGPGDGSDLASALAVSPDGRTLFVTGESTGSGTSWDFGTVAYDSSTGSQRWVARYSGAGDRIDMPYAIAVSPDGRRVFVTGRTDTDTGSDTATVAYNAATGAQLWLTLYDGPNHDGHNAFALAVSPDGSSIVVTGPSGLWPNDDYATVAYDAATGIQRWVAQYNGPGDGTDSSAAVGMSPDGGTVVVTGNSQGSAGSLDYATVAYDAATGVQRWQARYEGPGHGDDVAEDLVVSADGTKIVVTGRSLGSHSSYDYATLAYDMATGGQLWVARYDGPAHRYDWAFNVGISPDGGQAFVTGYSYTSVTAYGWATIAYDPATGGRLWLSRTSSGLADGLAVSPDGREVFVTGLVGSFPNADYGTAAYRLNP